VQHEDTYKRNVLRTYLGQMEQFKFPVIEGASAADDDDDDYDYDYDDMFWFNLIEIILILQK